MIDAEVLGYRSHDRPYPHAPGCAELDIVLRDSPTGDHFDPEKIQITLAGPSGDVQRSVITSRSFTSAEPLRVCAGRIVLVDRVEKRVQFLTLGGSLKITREDDFSLCRLRSPAPIITLSLSREPEEILAAEIEELLSQRRAIWETHPREFERRLATCDPATLYLACLAALSHRLEGRHPALGEDVHQLAHFVDAELAFLGSRGAAQAPALEDIL